MPKISVIVPIYKVEQYLSCCIDSILAQTYKDFELILIDDGSPDNCGSICDGYAEKDERIIVIHQNNQGLSGARNSGMDIARGEFITFIDSDDVVTEDYLEELLRAIEKTKADIAVCRMQKFTDQEIVDLRSSVGERCEYKIYDKRTAIIKIYEGSLELPVCAWGKLYKAETIEELRFPIGKLHEDDAMVPIMCYCANKIVTIDLQMYCYRSRMGSIMNEKFSVRRYDGIWAIDSCIEFFAFKQEKEIVKVAQKSKMHTMAAYAIFAKRDNVVVPEQYKISIRKALRYIKKNMPGDKYQYYLAQVYPKRAYLYEYERKLKQILGLTKNKYGD